jgi:hypothetical protein
MPGMLLTLQDIVENSTSKATIHSHKSIPHFFETVKGYRKGLVYLILINTRLEIDLRMNSIDKDYEYKDENLSVRAVTIVPETSNERLAKMQKCDPEPIHNHEAFQFICQGPDLLGKFDANAAKQLGIPIGPLYGINDILLIKL